MGWVGRLFMSHVGSVVGVGRRELNGLGAGDGVAVFKYG
jgi:hypothetical protein